MRSSLLDRGNLGLRNSRGGVNFFRLGSSCVFRNTSSSWLQFRFQLSVLVHDGIYYVLFRANKSWLRWRLQDLRRLVFVFFGVFFVFVGFFLLLRLAKLLTFEIVYRSSLQQRSSRLVFGLSDWFFWRPNWLLRTVICASIASWGKESMQDTFQLIHSQSVYTIYSCFDMDFIVILLSAVELKEGSIRINWLRLNKYDLTIFCASIVIPTHSTTTTNNWLNNCSRYW